MRRYGFPAQDPRLTVVVGWDNPLATCFAQVFDGTAPQAISTVAALQTQLAGWAIIPATLVAQLTREPQAATPPTPLQRWMQQLVYGISPAGGHTDTHPRCGVSPGSPWE